MFFFVCHFFFQHCFGLLSCEGAGEENRQLGVGSFRYADFFPTCFFALAFAS